jgi:AcrR family transcriptional regulator
VRRRLVTPALFAATRFLSCSTGAPEAGYRSVRSRRVTQAIPSTGPLRLPAAARRRQLLDRALEVFAAEGFHGTAMNDVAEAAGVTKPVLYQHFRSKRALYLELLDDVGEQLRAAITSATSVAGGPRMQVEAGFAAYFRHVDEHRSAFTLLFGSGARLDDGFAEAVRRVEAAIAETVAALIDADLDDLQRRVLAAGVVGLAESTSRFWMAEGLDIDPDALARQVADLAWAGLRGVRPLPAHGPDTPTAGGRGDRPGA